MNGDTFTFKIFISLNETIYKEIKIIIIVFVNKLSYISKYEDTLVHLN